MTVDATMSQPWWEKFSLNEGEGGYWGIGPLHIWAQRGQNEWRLASVRQGDALDTTLIIEVPTTRQLPEDISRSCRYGFRSAPKKIRLQPALADRPVMIQVATQFSVPPQEELTLFISSSLWIQILVGSHETLLREEPAWRPSDTWFGPSTMEGELCYAAKTHARHDLTNLPLRPHRAISAVKIRNRAGSHLPLERLKLPAPHMSLFADEQGRLWTETVILERKEEGDLAILELGGSPPVEAKRTRRVCQPREKPERGLLIRAFGSVFGMGE